MNDSLLVACAVGSVVSATLLLTAHVALWPFRSRLSRPGAYAVGSICVIVGVALASWLLSDWTPLVVYLACLLPGGAIITAAWWVRARIEDRQAADRTIRAAREVIEWPE